MLMKSKFYHISFCFNKIVQKLHVFQNLAIQLKGLKYNYFVYNFTGQSMDFIINFLKLINEVFANLIS